MSTTTMHPIVSLLSEGGPGPRDILVVEETLLPMLLLPDVPVVLRDVREPISILQRFLLQAAVDARMLDLHDAQQATSIPLYALRRLACEFAQSGLFTRDIAADRFMPNDDLCRRALATNRVELEKPGRLHLLFLPESSELVALQRDDTVRKFVSTLHACTPDAGYPTPGLEGRELHEFLQSHIERSAVTGLPPEFIRIEPPATAATIPSDKTGSPMPASVPAFRVSFTVTTGDKHPRCRLRLLAARKANEVELSAATKTIATTVHRATLSTLPTASIPALAHLGMPRDAQAELVFESPVRANVPLDAWSAKQVSAMTWLTRPHPVRVQQPELSLTTRASVSFFASDEVADRLFAIDEATLAVLSAPNAPTPQSLRAAVERSGRGVQDVDVRERLWQRREYARVHSIRAHEDLFHD